MLNTRVACAILWLSSVFLTGSAQERILESGKTHHGSIAASNEVDSLELTLSPEDFVRGSVAGDEMVLWLVDGDQRRVRRLAAGIGSRQAFMFVAGEKGPYSLQVSGPVGQSYTVQLRDVVPLADQSPPANPLASPTLRKLKKHLASGGDTSDFWEKMQQQGTPLVETTNVEPPLDATEALITFLWRGAKRNVRLFGAPSGDHDELARLPGSDIWYRSYRVPKTARIDYRLAPDVPQFDGTATEQRRAILATAQRDPFNPRHEPTKTVDIYDGVSIVELPDAPDPIWTTPNPSLPTGTVKTYRLTSQILGNTRDIHLYRTAGYRPDSPENAIVVTFDGDQYLNEIKLPLIFDNLVAAGKIPPTAAIMICNPSQQRRSAELPCNDNFARFIADELMPWVNEQDIHAARERTVIVGASFGGLASAFLGLKHPEIFGNVMSQSGSFWWAPGGFEAKGNVESQWLTRQYVTAPLQPVHYYLDVGTFETPSEILPCTRHLRDVLQAKGYDVKYNEFVGGHGYFYWRYSLADGIIHLLGASQNADQ
ncbi:Enterochelin esterase [Novipirellula aureliae]|uniref:Enterochelin esterase n=1 Tax=Novipirellula aureliae TaxID=2527966 RepID=A0A5C6DHT1_9BACT|nr:alpha/beta hydrolase-fold protein [Novipirellula aureliae]TWU35755.1 Enterochelin esterase [Novipirellula aureliae]